MRRAALYARVSTTDQRCEVQLEALREYARRRELEPVEFVDAGVSGAKADRAALLELLEAVRRRRVDVVVCTKLDRLFRNVRHLVTVVEEFKARDVDLVVLDQAIDTTSPTGRLLFHVLAAIAEFERDLIRDRVIAGVRRAQEHGTRSGKPIGRPRIHVVDVAVVQRLRQRRRPRMSLRAIARHLNVNLSAVQQAIRQADQNPGPAGARKRPGFRGSAKAAAR
jgi:DNA invertase Pin-like site-specific DNA recombinase